MPTEIHQHAARMLWQGYSTLDIVTELQNKFDILGDDKERELYVQVGRLRDQIKEARALAPAAAEQMFRDGLEWKEVIDALTRPFLISNFEATGIAQKAHAVVEAEQK